MGHVPGAVDLLPSSLSSLSCVTRGDKPREPQEREREMLQQCWQVKPSVRGWHTAALSPQGTPKLKSFTGRGRDVPGPWGHILCSSVPARAVSLHTMQPPLPHFSSRSRVQCQPVTFVTPQCFLPCKLGPFFPPIWTDKTDSDSAVSEADIYCEPTAPLSRWTKIILSLCAQKMLCKIW